MSTRWSWCWGAPLMLVVGEKQLGWMLSVVAVCGGTPLMEQLPVCIVAVCVGRTFLYCYECSVRWWKHSTE